MKICIVCGVEKIETDFPFRNKKRGILRAECKDCSAIYNKQYRASNTEYIAARKANFYQNNKSEILARQSKFYIKNKAIISIKKSEWYFNTIADRIQYEIGRRKQKSESAKNRRKNNVEIRLRGNFSSKIGKSLKQNQSSKMGKSISNYLSYTIQELKEHLEKQFEPWMNWNNYGKYNRNTWIDDNSLTWKWNIDHIISQADLPYQDMSDANFKKCWSLTNLRPYSAKQNNKDRRR